MECHKCMKSRVVVKPLQSLRARLGMIGFQSACRTVTIRSTLKEGGGSDAPERRGLKKREESPIEKEDKTCYAPVLMAPGFFALCVCVCDEFNEVEDWVISLMGSWSAYPMTEITQVALTRMNQSIRPRTIIYNHWPEVVFYTTRRGSD